MIQKIFDKIKSILSDSRGHSTALDQFIQSKNPKSLCDIERFTEEFERRSFFQGDTKL